MPAESRSLSFLAACGLMLCLIVLQMLIGAAFHDFHTAFEYGDPRSIVISVVAYGLLISAVMHHWGATHTQLFGRLDPDAPGPLVMGLAIALVIVGSLWWLSEALWALERLLPDDPYAIAMLDRLLDGGVVTVVAVCLVAPVIEEMFFRGLVLRGLLARYSVRKAVVLSAVLFGLIHLNVYQVPGAFVMGLFFGWLFVRYRSLWPCIFAHALMNSLAVAFSRTSEDAIPDSLTIDILSLAVSALGIGILLVTSRSDDPDPREDGSARP